MNSGILADPLPGASYDYAAAPAHLLERARRIGVVCARHGVDLKTAAIQFPLGHPQVASVAAGVRTKEHFEDYPRAMQAPVPEISPRPRPGSRARRAHPSRCARGHPHAG